MRASMGRRVEVLGAGLATFLFLSACAKDECTFSRDCPLGMQCEQKKCVESVPGHVDPRDAGPPDTGLADAGADAALDAALDASTDAGRDASIDAGAPDAHDGGAGDATTVPTGGSVWYDEATSLGVVEVAAGAEFFDRSQATYTRSTANFTNNPRAPCSLEVTRLRGGSITGLTSPGITFENAFGDSRRLAPDPAQTGRFIPAGTLAGGLFAMGDTISVVIDASGTPGQLAASGTSLPTPASVIAVAPAPGQVSLLAGVHLAWIVTPPASAVFAVVSDAPGEVVLTCGPILSGNDYDIPAEAIRAWYAESPTTPSTLEIRSDAKVGAQLPLEGGARIPASFRLSRGARWLAY